MILDACERIGDAWRTRWDSLRLFTPAALRRPGRNAVPRSHATPIPSKDEMADYPEAYADRFELPVRTGTRRGPRVTERRPASWSARRRAAVRGRQRRRRDRQLAASTRAAAAPATSTPASSSCTPPRTATPASSRTARCCSSARATRSVSSRETNCYDLLTAGAAFPSRPNDARRAGCAPTPRRCGRRRGASSCPAVPECSRSTAAATGSVASASSSARLRTPTPDGRLLDHRRLALEPGRLPRLVRPSRSPPPATCSRSSAAAMAAWASTAEGSESARPARRRAQSRLHPPVEQGDHVARPQCRSPRTARHPRARALVQEYLFDSGCDKS